MRTIGFPGGPQILWWRRVSLARLLPAAARRGWRTLSRRISRRVSVWLSGSTPLALAIVLLLAAAASPAIAAVTGTLHINAGYSDQTIGLVPGQSFTFHAPSDPLQTLTVQQPFNDGQVPPTTVFARSAEAMMDGSEGSDGSLAWLMRARRRAP